MSTVLAPEHRRLLDATVQKARAAAEAAAVDALHALAVDDTHRPPFLTDQQNELRLALRAKARQLGDDDRRRGADLALLVRDVAYEQWHRLLFARFLELNGLLMHPDFPDTPLSLEDCDQLARDEGEPDGWSLAARFAAQILPGVFRLDDPAVRLPLSAEHRVRLEQLLMTIPAVVFPAEDALGWVYQFWQTAEKKRVNDAGNKVGGADLSPVTQLFTENYMVRFLLENSLGAWWAARHPDSTLAAEWKFLRRLDDGTPAAGMFREWPERAAEVTVMDPCCGSGHFLVAMFGMLWRMRAEEERLPDAEAQDAVLRDNLFGLELDPRCTQIATFNVTLEAWKQGGYRRLPTPQIACSGVPVRQTREEWVDGVPEHLHETMGRLHSQFRNADTLGSLIDTRPEELPGGQLFDSALTIVTWEQLSGHLAVKFAQESAFSSVLGQAAEDVVHAAKLLAGRYNLVATNPPFLNDQKMSPRLMMHCQAYWPNAAAELATVFIDSFRNRLARGGALAFVSPNNWLYLKPYLAFRKRALRSNELPIMAQLGPNSFAELKGEVVKPVLSVHQAGRTNDSMFMVDVSERAPDKRADLLQSAAPYVTTTVNQLGNPNQAITFRSAQSQNYMGDYCSAHLGISTGDNNRFARKFWEFTVRPDGWERTVGTSSVSVPYGGRSEYLKWQDGAGELYDFITERLGDGRQGSWIRGRGAWGQKGICASRAGKFSSTIYAGELFLDGAAVIVPRDLADLPAIWHYMQAPAYARAVRAINQKVIATVSSMPKVPFDLEYWQKVADEAGPLPEQQSDDPTQWLFKGDIKSSTQPLQVAMARLLGYRWPDQEPDDCDRFADADGIVTLPNLGERDAASRLRELLAVAYGVRWSSALEHTLVAEAGGTSGRLEDWLRDTFFAHHCKVFDSRPFLWHVRDGRKDGFSAVLHYHRLDRRTLEKLTYTSLGTWIRRQTQEVSAGTAGAEARLVAAEELKVKLEAIIGGEQPYDAYVRWKPMHEQPIGWEPDLHDGVRFNIRPFVTAGILRSQINVHWRKDRGKNPDGTSRINDLHPTLDERRTARAAHQASDA